MPNIAHFDVPADDVPRARSFYEQVFGWQFNAWRQEPDFYQIRTGSDNDPGIMGALARRHTHAANPAGANAFICTVSVDSIDETAKLVAQHGGTITYPKNVIRGVGWIIQFLDTEGNTVSAMQYDASAR